MNTVNQTPQNDASTDYARNSDADRNGNNLKCFRAVELKKKSQLSEYGNLYGTYSSIVFLILIQYYIFFFCEFPYIFFSIFIYYLC